MAKKTKIFITVIAGIVSLPSMVWALTGTFKTNVEYVLSLIYIIIPILFGLAFIVFFWGLSKFILNSGSEPERKKGKEYIMWGILALFVLISFRGIISFMAGELEFGSASAIPFLKANTSTDSSKLTVPKIPGQN